MSGSFHSAADAAKTEGSSPGKLNLWELDKSKAWRYCQSRQRESRTKNKWEALICVTDFDGVNEINAKDYLTICHSNDYQTNTELKTGLRELKSVPVQHCPYWVKKTITTA